MFSVIFFTGKIEILITFLMILQGFRYRFRVISNGFLNCPIQLSIDNHTLLAIASDGGPIQPVECITYF